MCNGKKNLGATSTMHTVGSAPYLSERRLTSSSKSFATFSTFGTCRRSSRINNCGRCIPYRFFFVAISWCRQFRDVVTGRWFLIGIACNCYRRCLAILLLLHTTGQFGIIFLVCHLWLLLGSNEIYENGVWWDWRKKKTFELLKTSLFSFRIRDARVITVQYAQLRKACLWEIA